MTVPANNIPRDGVFGARQGATPKYARHVPRNDDFKETMARLFIRPPDGRADAIIKRATHKVKGAGAKKALAQLFKNGYIDFLLQGVSAQLTEKLDVVENMSDGYVAYYMGQMPAMLQCNGVLLNTLQDDQLLTMVQLYEAVIRGTRLAENQVTVRLRFDSFLYTGTISAFQWSHNADFETYAPFSFAFLVKSREVLPSPVFTPTALGDVDLPGKADALGNRMVPQRVSATVTPQAVTDAPVDPAKETTPPASEEEAREAVKDTQVRLAEPLPTTSPALTELVVPFARVTDKTVPIPSELQTPGGPTTRKTQVAIIEGREEEVVLVQGDLGIPTYRVARAQLTLPPGVYSRALDDGEKRRILLDPQQNAPPTTPSTP